MITDKETLVDYLEKDKWALRISNKRRRPSIIGQEIWRYQYYLRMHEYYLNTQSNKISLLYYKIRHHYMGIKLGFSIPCNVFGPGLRINHWGLIVVNSKARVGSFCELQQGVNIGEDYLGRAPVIGNNVYIGPGAKIYGDIKIGDNSMVGANAVVNKSFIEGNCSIVGCPAKIGSKKTNVYARKCPY